MDDEYEIVPEKDIAELKDELRRLKAVDSEPTKFGGGVSELNSKIDRLLAVFEQAYDEMKSNNESEVHKEIITKLDKIIDQHAEIAQGIVELHDAMGGQNQELSTEISGLPPLPEIPEQDSRILPPPIVQAMPVQVRQIPSSVSTPPPSLPPRVLSRPIQQLPAMARAPEAPSLASMPLPPKPPLPGMLPPLRSGIPPPPPGPPKKRGFFG